MNFDQLDEKIIVIKRPVSLIKINVTGTFIIIFSLKCRMNIGTKVAVKKDKENLH